MKKFILLLLLLPLFLNAQAHLGSTEKEIRELHSGSTFEVGHTDKGEKYISAFMFYGTFVYYFNPETGLSDGCIQLVNDTTALNEQVAVYNSKYVAVSDSEWKAYLEGGNVLKIGLSYSDEFKVYVFNYTL
jgi:hypothetical protein